MIQKLLATTAIVTLLAGSAYAQEATTPAPAAPAPMTDDAAQAPVAAADGFLATNLIGETVYNGTSDDAENIGEVNDLVIGATGGVDQIIVGVGGFLGLGEKNVALNFNEIDWAERDGDRWMVVSATKEQLEAQPEFDMRPYQVAPAATAMAPAGTDGAAPADTMAAAPADGMATAPADGTTAAPAEDMAAAPEGTATQAPAATTTAPDQTQTGAIDRSTLTEMPADQIRGEELAGTTVYGANEENVGEIGDVVLSQDGKVDAVIIDVGGFLGIGEKEVAVGMDKLAFMTDADGNKYLYTTFTEEQLNAAPAYDEANWATTRDQQRIMVE
jgi:sporulation protein YlmC with PRC-barrel domain